MNRSFAVFTGVAAVGLTLMLTIKPAVLRQPPLGKATLQSQRKRQDDRRRSPNAAASARHQLTSMTPRPNLVLNNVSNTVQHYSEIGQKVEIEVVAFGPGLHMLREDTSPVKARIKSMSETTPELTFSACGNTRENMTRAEAKEIPLISQAKVTKSGVVRLMELQELGWSYLRP